MSIFKNISFYIALLGVILTVILVSKLMRPVPEPTPYVLPAANPYEYTVAASGIIEAVDRNILIGVPVSGLVEKILVNVGDNVEAGQVLFILDGREYRGRLEVQEANLAVARANLDRLKDQLSRLESVKDPRSVSAEELKTKQNDVLVSEAQLKAAQAGVDETVVLLNRLKIQAPRSGQILQNNIRVGEYINTGEATAAMVLGNLDKLQIRADIDEQNAMNYIKGSKATAFPRNNTTLAMPLTFSYIEPFVIPKKSLTGSSVERVDTRVLQVIYTFEKPQDFPVYIGQQVDVFIEGKQ